MSEKSGASFVETIYGKMSDEELQNTLRCEMLSGDVPDSKQIDLLLAEMERRGINEPIRSPEEAWVEFEEEYPEEPSLQGENVVRYSQTLIYEPLYSSAQYRAVVVFYAAKGSGSDTGTYTTNSVS